MLALALGLVVLWPSPLAAQQAVDEPQPEVRRQVRAVYMNPIFRGDYPDPTIVRVGDDYYMTHSSFDYQPGLIVFHSTDLINWEPLGPALKKYLGSVWAPDISYYDGKFYIYFTVASDRGKTNYVTWSVTPDGPWSDPIDLKIGNIDPCHVVGEDGVRWLFMSGGRRVRLSEDGLSVMPETMELVYLGWRYPREWQTEGFCLEGPKIRRIGDYYYYLNAEGGTAGPPTSHMVVVARSKSLDGPWENSPYNPMVHTYSADDRWWSKGHGSLIDTKDGRWYIVYHAYENGYQTLGRQTLLEPVMMTSDEWIRTSPDTRLEGYINTPLRPASTGDPKARLGEFRIGYEWRHYLSYETRRSKVNKKGSLVMKGKGDGPGNSSPLLFVAGDHSYEIEAEIELSGDKVMAGLVLFYNAGFHMGTGFDSTHRYRFRKDTSSRTGASMGNHLWLRLRNDKHIVTGEYSFDGEHWERESWGMDISGYHHNTLYEFQSVLPGIFVAGKGSATISNFKYRRL